MTSSSFSAIAIVPWATLKFAIMILGILITIGIIIKLFKLVTQSKQKV